MNRRAGRVLLYWLSGCVFAIGLVACGKSSSPTEAVVTPESSFAAPISNQVAPHDESDHNESDHNESDSDEANHDDLAASQDGAASGDNGHEAEAHGHTHLDPALATAEMGVALVPSELVVGLNRFAVGLFNKDGQAVVDADVYFHYFDLSNPSAPVPESEAHATKEQTPDGLTTIFAQDREFDRAGDWGVEIEATFPDGTASMKRIGFTVLPDSTSPMPGEKAPSVDTAVAGDVGNDLTKLTSSLTPNPAFYERSLAEAMSNGKPTVLLFATPAFCQTRFCGPAYDVTSELQHKYGERANFIHVEIYTGLPDPTVNNWELAPAMTAFGLSTEPWLFLLDRDGVVVYRVEGLFTAEEIEQYLPALVGS